RRAIPATSVSPFIVSLRFVRGFESIGNNLPKKLLAFGGAAGKTFNHLTKPHALDLLDCRRQRSEIRRQGGAALESSGSKIAHQRGKTGGRPARLRREDDQCRGEAVGQRVNPITPAVSYIVRNIEMAARGALRIALDVLVAERRLLEVPRR